MDIKSREELFLKLLDDSTATGFVAVQESSQEQSNCGKFTYAIHKQGIASLYSSSESISVKGVGVPNGFELSAIVDRTKKIIVVTPGEVLTSLKGYDVVTLKMARESLRLEIINRALTILTHDALKLIKNGEEAIDSYIKKEVQLLKDYQYVGTGLLHLANNMKMETVENMILERLKKEGFTYAKRINQPEVLFEYATEPSFKEELIEEALSNMDKESILEYVTYRYERMVIANGLKDAVIPLSKLSEQISERLNEDKVVYMHVVSEGKTSKRRVYHYIFNSFAEVSDEVKDIKIFDGRKNVVKFADVDKIVCEKEVLYSR